MRTAWQAEAVQGVGDGGGARSDEGGDVPGQDLGVGHDSLPVSAAWNLITTLARGRATGQARLEPRGGRPLNGVT